MQIWLQVTWVTLSSHVKLPCRRRRRCRPCTARAIGPLKPWWALLGWLCPSMIHKVFSLQWWAPRAFLHSSLTIHRSSVMKWGATPPPKVIKESQLLGADTSESDLDAVGIAPAIGPRPGLWLGKGVRFNCGVLPKSYGYCQWRSS